MPSESGHWQFRVHRKSCLHGLQVRGLRPRPRLARRRTFEFADSETRRLPEASPGPPPGGPWAICSSQAGAPGASLENHDATTATVAAPASQFQMIRTPTTLRHGHCGIVVPSRREPETRRPVFNTGHGSARPGSVVDVHMPVTSTSIGGTSEARLAASAPRVAQIPYKHPEPPAARPGSRLGAPHSALRGST